MASRNEVEDFRNQGADVPVRAPATCSRRDLTPSQEFARRKEHLQRVQEARRAAGIKDYA